MHAGYSACISRPWMCIIARDTITHTSSASFCEMQFPSANGAQGPIHPATAGPAFSFLEALTNDLGASATFGRPAIHAIDSKLGSGIKK